MVSANYDKTSQASSSPGVGTSDEGRPKSMYMLVSPDPRSGNINMALIYRRIPVPYYWIKFGDGDELSKRNRYRGNNPDFWFKVANNGAKFPREIMPDGKSYSKGKRLEYDILLRPGFINAHIVFGGRSEFYQVFPAHGVDAEKFRQQIISLVASFSNANFTNNDSIEEFVKTAKANICNGEVYGIFSPDVNEPFLVSHQRILKFVKTLTTEDIPPPPADPEIYNRVWHIKTSSPISGVSLFVIMHRDDGVLNWQYSVMHGMEGTTYNEISELTKLAIVTVQDGVRVNQAEICKALTEAVSEINGLDSIPVRRSIIA